MNRDFPFCYTAGYLDDHPDVFLLVSSCGKLKRVIGYLRRHVIVNNGQKMASKIFLLQKIGVLPFPNMEFSTTIKNCIFFSSSHTPAVVFTID